MATARSTEAPEFDAGRIGPDDPRYHGVVDKRFNKRFRAAPDYVRLAGSTADVVAAVAEAVRDGRRLAVTSGGHCLEGFVSDPEVRVIVDLSPIKAIAYDPERRAIVVGAGATVGETYQALYERWGVVVPLGEHPGIGMGGHVPGGAFGFLCRQLGLAADYLEAVEVVTVDASGRAASVIASRDPADPHHDLWWAHTGGGAGTFGVATRFWFRSREAAGDDPATLLPRAPASMTTFKAAWDWEGVSEGVFLRLLQNHGAWCERHAGADSAYASLWTLLELHRRQAGPLVIRGVSSATASAGRQIDEQIAALSAGIAPPADRTVETQSWLTFALDPMPDLFVGPPGGVSMKMKDAMLRRRLSDRQIGVAWHWLTRGDHDVMGGMLGLATYGGRVNTIAPEATASAHRGSIIDLACTTGWLDTRDDAKNLAWVRGFYGDLFADTGGVPVPGDAYDGALINHPDVDLADPALNTSGVAWPALYYRDNAARLRGIKARWDPLQVFRHALSVPA